MSYKILYSEIPIFYFYIGIIIESTIFMLGLGYKVKLLYTEKILVQQLIIEEQKKLEEFRNSQQMELESKLNEKIAELRAAIEQTEAEKMKSLSLMYDIEIPQLRLDALRTQMNPHFIFNALNSIKAYLIDNNKEKAIYYLNKFARLIKKILEGSCSEGVTLAEEIETIQLYLSIETIRFNETMISEFKIDPEIDLNSLRIPSLILQPFIENALWHGLMHKAGQKLIIVDVCRDGDIISLSISDNGIGRERAAKLNESRTFKKGSLGIQLAQERLDYFNKKNNAGYSFFIEDTRTEDGSSAGTKVTFRLKV